MSKENIGYERIKESDITNLFNYVSNQPGWVRQYLFHSLCEPGKYASKEDKTSQMLIQCYKPLPESNFYALQKDRFESFLLKLNVHQIVFLECVEKGRNFIEICCDKQWSLKKCCHIFLSLIAKQVISIPDDKRVLILIDFIIKKITLEEYLVRSKRLTIKQLDSALYAQKRTLEETGESPSIEEVLIKLDYMAGEEIDVLYQLVNTADKPCAIEDKSFELEIQIKNMHHTIEKLKLEINTLKEDKTKCQDLLLKKSADIVELTQEVNKQKESFSLKSIISTVFSTQT